MFTGIIETIGTISHCSPLGTGMDCEITTTEALCSQLKTGDSIAIDGVCSTAISIQNTTFRVQFLEETLSKTHFKTLNPATSVNLELSLTPNSRIGGHFVTGHIDGTGTVKELIIQDPWAILGIHYPPENRPLLLPKGSITINGIALTLVEIHPTYFTCHIIPHTLSNTTLSTFTPDQVVNLEYDIIGKYLYNFSQYGTNRTSKEA